MSTAHTCNCDDAGHALVRPFFLPRNFRPAGHSAEQRRPLSADRNSAWRQVTEPAAANFAGMTPRFRFLSWPLPLLLALAGPAGAYRLGLCPIPTPGATPAAVRQWALEAGCTMPRLSIRADLWRQPGGRVLPDQAVRECVAAGAEPLIALSPGSPVLVRDESGAPVRRPLPAGLFEPAFADGGDTARPGGSINPENTWAGFVNQVIERYDGDGQDDAAGSPQVIWFTIDAPTGADVRAVPLTPAELARLLRVAAAAAGAAADGAKVGLRVAEPAALDAVLRDPTNRVTSALDFVDFTVPVAEASDAALFGHHGVASTALRYQAVLWDSGAYADLLCGGVGVPAGLADGRLQRAAAVKCQLIGAVYDLATVQWSAVCDPSDGLVGLLGDARLRGDQTERPPARDAWYAYLSLSKLMGPELADGRAKFQDELPVGNLARCYRFELDGQELLVAWALDLKGDPGQTAEVRVPLRRDVQYGRYQWDYSLTGRAESRVVGGRDGYLTTLGIDPEFFLAGGDRMVSPVVRAEPATPAPWTISASSESAESPARLAVDGDPTTAWSAAGRPAAWWTIHFERAPVTITEIAVKLSAGSGPVTVEASEDGVIWRPVSDRFTADGFATRTVKLKRRVSSGWWRLVWSETDEAATLYEVSFGDGPGMPGW